MRVDTNGYIGERNEAFETMYEGNGMVRMRIEDAPVVVEDLDRFIAHTPF